MHKWYAWPDKKRKNTKKAKKAVNTRWLRLHASVDVVYDEYVVLLETLKDLRI